MNDREAIMWMIEAVERGDLHGPHPSIGDAILEVRAPLAAEPASQAEPDRRSNGGIECDSEEGPCSCGAWHKQHEKHPSSGPDEAQLEQWQALADAALPGPWSATEKPDEAEFTLSNDTYAIAWEVEENEAVFLAAARTAVPALIVALRQAREDRDSAWKDLDEARVQLPDLIEGLYQESVISRGLKTRLEGTIKMRDSARAQLAEAERVLSFYADPATYHGRPDYEGTVDSLEIDHDNGRRARDYLAGKAKK